MPQTVLYSRRVTPHAEVGDRVYASWCCKCRGDLSHVADVSKGGISIEAPIRKDLGTSVELNILVSEGQIRAKAVERVLFCFVRDDGVDFEVRHLQGASEKKGLGLVAMRERVSAIAGTLRIESHPGVHRRKVAAFLGEQS